MGGGRERWYKNTRKTPTKTVLFLSPSVFLSLAQLDHYDFRNRTPDVT